METKRSRQRRIRGSGSLIKKGAFFYAVFTVCGKRVWRATYETERRKAEKAFAKMSATMRAIYESKRFEAIADRIIGEANDRPADAAVALTDLWGWFRKDPNRPDCGARNFENYRHHLEHFTKWCSTAYPAVSLAREVTQVVADDYIEARRKECSAGTVNKDLNALAMIWRVLSRPCALKYNPWSDDKIIRRKGSKETRRVLSSEELDRVVNSAEGEMLTLMMLGRETPYRLGDCVSMKWDEVRLDEKIITKRTSKTGAFTVCPVSDALACHLNRIKRSGEYLMPKFAKSSAVSRRITSHFKACGITRLTDAGIADFHSFRHTWISRMIARGVNPAVVQRVAGHASIQMTGHYTHFEVDDIKRAFD